MINFTYTRRDDERAYLYRSDTAHGVGVMQLGNRLTVYINDARGVNALVFTMCGVAEDDHAHVADMCLWIAIAANGNVRKLVEDHRVLLLMKQYDLSEIYHTKYAVDNSQVTLWTPDDAYALNS